jgi:hypothetical protein
MILPAKLVAQTALFAGPLERWAEGFGGGFVKGALIGGVIAVIIAIAKGSGSWGGSAATQARLAARGQLASAAPAAEAGSSVGCWSIIRAVLLLGGAALCGLLGIYYMLAGTEVQKLAELGQATPQSLTAEQLLDKGPGKNIHVELQQFSFGAQVIEKNSIGDWEHVWLVLKPATAPAKGKYTTIVLRSSKVKDQGQLDELRKQTTLDAVVTSPLSDGMPIKVVPSETFLKANSKLDVSRTLFLNDRLLVTNLFGSDLTGTDLFDASQSNMFFAIGGVLCVVGAVLFVLIFVRRKKQAVD